MPQRVAVVGGGWAGLAAAVRAVGGGHAVTVYEASRQWGGRARSLPMRMPDGTEVIVDNGQHILIGAYVETLSLMEQVGVRPAEVLLRVPLDLRFPDGTGLSLPAWPAPLDALGGILSARGWTWADRWSMLRASLGWQAGGFRCDTSTTVAQLCHRLTPRVMQELVEPLCVSALNIPAERASGQVFLTVLRDALFGRGWGPWAGSNLLLPRAPLGALFPEAAAQWLEANGATLHAGARVTAIDRIDGGWGIDGSPFDQVVLACPAWEAARLASQCGAPAWAAQAGGLAHEAITTVYALGTATLPSAIVALRPGPGAPAQFAFDRSRLDGPAGLLAFVVSASEGSREEIETQVVAQAAALGWPVRPLQTVVEKRATFACTPGLQRPPLRVAPGLWACGDHVAGPYPATLEGAVRSAREAVDAMDASVETVARTRHVKVTGDQC